MMWYYLPERCICPKRVSAGRVPEVAWQDGEKRNHTTIIVSHDFQNRVVLTEL